MFGHGQVVERALRAQQPQQPVPTPAVQQPAQGTESQPPAPTAAQAPPAPMTGRAASGLLRRCSPGKIAPFLAAAVRRLRDMSKDCKRQHGVYLSDTNKFGRAMHGLEQSAKVSRDRTCIGPLAVTWLQ